MATFIKSNTKRLLLKDSWGNRVDAKIFGMVFANAIGTPCIGSKITDINNDIWKVKDLNIYESDFPTQERNIMKTGVVYEFTLEKLEDNLFKDL